MLEENYSSKNFFVLNAWHTLRSTYGGYSLGYVIEVFGAPVKGAVADHRGGYAFDDDARSGR
jgi:hypothetical protein